MSINTIQGRFNANKELTIKILKERGCFIEHNSEHGFIYTISGNVFDKLIRFTLALRNGFIQVLDMKSV